LIAGISAAAVGADTPSSLRQRAGELRRANATLSQRSDNAVLSLYALDAELASTQARIATLDAEAARIRSERASVRLRLHFAKRTLRTAERQLALRLHSAYEQGQTDALAVMLGATSIDDAITGLDDLNRTAQLDRRVSAETRRARAALRRLAGALAHRDAEIQSLAGAARSSLASLQATRSAREDYIASLASQQRLNAAQIGQLDARATAAVARTRTVAPLPPAPAPSGSSSPPTIPTQRTRAITVVATGYSLAGTTSIGMPVGWGVVAVDPSLIPLGTRLMIPGYGEGVAADTGSAVQGATIDLWFPTGAQALAWGRRTVTITLH
jgi:3D (Asp-Asp-Asp) domain-containing protein/peptidoglycan hydrolase CwlO-like protein